MKEQIKSSVGFFTEGVKITLKLGIIFFLTLALLIPKFMIMDLVKERKRTKANISQSIAAQLGGSQQIVGPVLCVPYEVSLETSVTTDGKTSVETTTVESTAFAIPLSLDINSTVNVDLRKKSIYRIPAFKSNAAYKFTFADLDSTELGANFIGWQWDKAYLAIGTSDLLGLQAASLSTNNEAVPFEAGIKEANFLVKGIHVPVTEELVSNNKTLELNLDVRGTNSLQFAPIGKQSTLKMVGDNWADVNFEGIVSERADKFGVTQIASNTLLPTDYNIDNTTKSFESNWAVSGFNMQLPQQWTGAQKPNLKDKFIGSQFIQLSDHYVKTERSVKYMVLFIGLIFLTFFISELLTKNNIHPFQYILVGTAIAIFFILLLAISEYTGFNRAYMLATAATISLITLYSLSVFKKKSLSILLAGLLIALFIFLFVVLQAAQFSLLMGAIGLFVVLALVMYFTRNVNWSGSSNSSNQLV